MSRTRADYLYCRYQELCVCLNCVTFPLFACRATIYIWLISYCGIDRSAAPGIYQQSIFQVPIFIFKIISLAEVFPMIRSSPRLFALFRYNSFLRDRVVSPMLNSPPLSRFGTEDYGFWATQSTLLPIAGGVRGRIKCKSSYTHCT